MRKRGNVKAVLIVLFVFAFFFLAGFLIGKAKGYGNGYDNGYEEAYESWASYVISYTSASETDCKSKEIEHEPIQEQEFISASEWYSEDDVFCLAAVIYQEAGGDDFTNETRRMVADVVLNRTEMNGFPNTIREVLEDAPNGCMQYGTFSVTGVQFAPEKLDNPNEQDAIMRSWWVAEDVLRGNHSELYGNGYCWQAEFVQGTDGFWR